jgi:hypothetical protein
MAMKRLLELLRQTEFHIFLFFLLFMLMDWPFLAVAAEGGLASMFMFLYGLWAVVILLLFLIQKSLRGKGPGDERQEGGG